MTTRPATLADLDRIAPLFDAYRQFYEQPADLAAATCSVTELKGLFGTPTRSVSIEEMNQAIAAPAAANGR